MSSVILRLLVRVQFGGQGFLFSKTTNATHAYFMLYPNRYTECRYIHIRFVDTTPDVLASVAQYRRAPD